MRRLIALAALVMLSFAAYIALFSVVHRPLVVGEIHKQLAYKLGYARTLDAPKIVIFAGSNGRYSHRCAEFTERLGKPCVNASIGVGLGLDFLLEQWQPLLRRGDWIYMPLEYGQYRSSAEEMHAGLQNALLVHNNREYLWGLGAQRVAAAYGSFDLPFLIHGTVEMALDGHGFRRRSSIDNLTKQGDESGHTAASAKPFAAFLREADVDSSRGPETSYAIGVIQSFLRQMRDRGVVVVGGLPTLPAAALVEPTDVQRLRSLFESNGQRFLQLSNLSRYPIGCFFDTPYHLNEACQQAHSARVATELDRLMQHGAQRP